jgi:hypothetical protein
MFSRSIGGPEYFMSCALPRTGVLALIRFIQKEAEEGETAISDAFSDSDTLLLLGSMAKYFEAVGQ